MLLTELAEAIRSAELDGFHAEGWGVTVAEANRIAEGLVGELADAIRSGGALPYAVELDGPALATRLIAVRQPPLRRGPRATPFRSRRAQARGRQTL